MHSPYNLPRHIQGLIKPGRVDLLQPFYMRGCFFLPHTELPPLRPHRTAADIFAPSSRSRIFPRYKCLKDDIPEKQSRDSTKSLLNTLPPRNALSITCEVFRSSGFSVIHFASPILGQHAKIGCVPCSTASQRVYSNTVKPPPTWENPPAERNPESAGT